MDQIQIVESIAKFNSQRGQENLHPLVTVLDQSKSKPIQPARFLSELYIIFLKEQKCGELKYGRRNYDYQEGTLVFIAPGQVYGISENIEIIQEMRTA